MSHLPATSQPDLDHETSMLLDYMHNENLPDALDETQLSPTDLPTSSNFDQQGHMTRSFSSNTAHALASLNEMSIASPGKRQASTSPSANTRAKRSTNDLVMFTRDDLVAPNPDRMMIITRVFVTNSHKRNLKSFFLRQSHNNRPLTIKL